MKKDHGLFKGEPRLVYDLCRSHIRSRLYAVLIFIFIAPLKGARPGVFQGVQVQQLATFLKEKMPGAVVLSHDESAASWSEKLDHRLVYGIREVRILDVDSSS